MTNPLNNLSQTENKITNSNKKKDKNKNKTGTGEYPEISAVASANGMTGLMHAPPQNKGELESYKDLSGMPVPKKKK